MSNSNRQTSQNSQQINLENFPEDHVSNTGNRTPQVLGTIDINDLIEIATSRQNIPERNQSNSHSREHIVNLNDNGSLPEEIYQTPDQAAGNEESRNILSVVFSILRSILPFFLVLVAKVFHQHLLGFFIVLGFMTTLHWSNKNLVHQVELRDKKQNLRLTILILFLLLNALVFFVIFKDYELYYCLVLMKPNIIKMDIWNLLWVVVCLDTIIKFMTIILKALITLLPFKIMPLRKRGAYYSCIETTARLYRSLTPIHPWILFIFYVEKTIQITSNNEKTTDTVTTENHLAYFDIILCIFYAICKLNQLWEVAREFLVSCTDLNSGLSTMRMTTVTSENEDNKCPICQDKLASPVLLKCQHVFCEDCVCIWLDKENSCPMCRAKVAIKKPQYRDGSVEIFVQWY